MPSGDKREETGSPPKAGASKAPAAEAGEASLGPVVILGHNDSWHDDNWIEDRANIRFRAPPGTRSIAVDLFLPKPMDDRTVMGRLNDSRGKIVTATAGEMAQIQLSDPTLETRPATLKLSVTGARQTEGDRRRLGVVIVRIVARSDHVSDS